MTVLVAIFALIITASAATAHGGGCRKSSPPGQCCHMDNSVGTFTATSEVARRTGEQYGEAALELDVDNGRNQ